MNHWYDSYTNRILAWRQFREQQATVPLAAALTAINHWWHQSPIKKVHTLIEDPKTWPEPWVLLKNLSYCDIERALGMYYTIMLADRNDVKTCEISIFYNDVGERLSAVIVNKDRVLNVDSNATINITDIHSEFRCVATYDHNDLKYNH